jgi:hypothetical protein
MNDNIIPELHPYFSMLRLGGFNMPQQVPGESVWNESDSRAPRLPQLRTSLVAASTWEGPIVVVVASTLLVSDGCQSPELGSYAAACSGVHRFLGSFALITSLIFEDREDKSLLKLPHRFGALQTGSVHLQDDIL